MTAALHSQKWATIPLRYVCKLNPSVIFEELTAEDDLTFLPMEKVRNGFFIPNTEKFSKYGPSYTSFEDGDIVLAKVTPCFENGNIAVASELIKGKGFGSSELFVIRAVAVDRNFLFYYFQSSRFKQEGEASMTGAGGLKRVSPDVLRQHNLPFPASDIQHLIAKHLDRETARIDKLISEKDLMLTLLEEKRIAFISQIVTQGLDPEVNFKYSSHAWLGDIPSHWQLQPIKYLAHVGNGSTPSVDNEDYWSEDGFPWLNSSVVNQAFARIPSRFVTTNALRECHLPVIDPPAVLVGITGQGKTRGMASLLAIKATINQHLAYLKPKDERLSANYLRAILTHAYEFLRSDSDGAGSTKGAITCEQLANTKIPIPPAKEQEEICSRIDQFSEKSEPLIANIRTSINLLRNRRNALITAAVTGQIPLEEMTP